MINAKHKKEIAGFIKNGDYTATDSGILVHDAIMAKGVYTHSVNGEDEQRDPNIIPAEGIAYILDTALGGVAQIPNWYLAVFSGAVTPNTTWTAANFSANASEIISNVEGYSELTRPAWVPQTTGTTNVGVIDNINSQAVYTIACTTTINISGAGLLSTNTKGGTTGTLASASRFASVRVLNNTDTFRLGYEVEIQDV